MLGVIRTSPEYLSKRKGELKKELNSEAVSKADLKRAVCFTTNNVRLSSAVWQGREPGPDLTGSGRSNLDYLLENIVDPNGAVSADYRMNILKLKDGRILSGMIAGQDRNSVTLRMPESETVVSKTEIKKRETIENSIMPAGLLDNLKPEERRDLIAYLMHSQSVN